MAAIVHSLMVFLMAVFLGTASGQERQYTSDMVSDPRVNYTECGNERWSYVCDPTDFMNQTRVRQINSSVYEMIDINNCPCENCPADRSGYVIGVVLLPNINSDRPDRYDAIKDFARGLREEWRLGTCDNDALLLVLADTMEVVTDQGSRMELHISDPCFHRANELGRPFFRQNQWGAGILAIMDEYRQMLEVGCYLVAADEYINEKWLYGALAAITVLLVLMIVFVIVRCRRPDPQLKQF